MTFETSFSIMFSALKGLYPFMFITVISTLCAVVIVTVLSRKLWVNKERFRWLGIFFNLDTISAVAISFSWLKLIDTIILIYISSKPNLLIYVFYLTPVILGIIFTRPIKGIAGRILWSVLECTGVFSVNIVRNYINDTHGTMVLYFILICMMVMMTLYALYVFLIELDKISENRKGSLYLDTDFFE